MSRDLVVIGGGAAGLAAAQRAVELGRRPLVISDGPPGGDCTFTGCVPSKTLIEAAAAGAKFAEALRRVHEAVARIAATEDERALAKRGIEVLRGRGRHRAARLHPRRLCHGADRRWQHPRPKDRPVPRRCDPARDVHRP